MPDFVRVSPGEPLEIRSTDWNAAMDAAEAHATRSRPPLPGVDAPPLPYLAVPVKNTTGGALDRFDVLAVSGSVWAPTANLESWKNEIYLEGITPTADYTGRFVVLIEPAAAAGIALGVVAGVVQCQVDIKTAGDLFCDCAAANTTNLESAQTGPAQILAANHTTGLGWAIVRVADRTNTAQTGGLAQVTSAGLTGFDDDLETLGAGVIQPKKRATGTAIENDGTTVVCWNMAGPVAGDAWIQYKIDAYGDYFVDVELCADD